MRITKQENTKLACSLNENRKVGFTLAKRKVRLSYDDSTIQEKKTKKMEAKLNGSVFPVSVSSTLFDLSWFGSYRLVCVSLWFLLPFNLRLSKGPLGLYLDR